MSQAFIGHGLEFDGLGPLPLQAYQSVVCGFNVRIADSLVALEAAHIKWHQAGGPDMEYNGIALCSLHH